jgi:hypothetical protein|tara:strand:+ start:28 stop:210 length:183 start_codon:yes stop_codon:yes gene_type:complete
VVVEPKKVQMDQIQFFQQLHLLAVVLLVNVVHHLVTLVLTEDLVGEQVKVVLLDQVIHHL